MVPLFLPWPTTPAGVKCIPHRSPKPALSWRTDPPRFHHDSQEGVRCSLGTAYRDHLFPPRRNKRPQPPGLIRSHRGSGDAIWPPGDLGVMTISGSRSLREFSREQLHRLSTILFIDQCRSQEQTPGISIKIGKKSSLGELRCCLRVWGWPNLGSP